MKWQQHLALSDADMESLVGTPLMEKLQRTRLIIIYAPDEKIALKEQMGLFECAGVYYVRNLQGRDDIVEVLFEAQEDLEMVQESLVQYKLSLD